MAATEPGSVRAGVPWLRFSGACRGWEFVEAGTRLVAVSLDLELAVVRRCRATAAEEGAGVRASVWAEMRRTAHAVSSHAQELKICYMEKFRGIV